MKTTDELFDLAGRTALVTGGAGHIGLAIAQALYERGATVALLDLDAHRLDTAAEALGNARTLTYALDLSNTHRLVDVPQQIVAATGRLDILVNCAALVGTSGLAGWAVPVEQQSVDTWRLALEVNLTAPFALAQAAAPHLRTSGRGSIVNVLSIYALCGPDERLYEGTPLGNPAAYGASKAGLMQLTRHLATTLAPHVRVNALTPGGVQRGQDAKFVERYESRTPLARMATEEDFKGAALFLASDASAYVTGQNIVVDGGWSAW